METTICFMTAQITVLFGEVMTPPGQDAAQIGA
jgi:hypothetical protein